MYGYDLEFVMVCGGVFFLFLIVVQILEKFWRD